MKNEFEVPTSSRIQLKEITGEVERIVREARISSGLCTVYCPHTTAGLVINENADPDVALDLQRAFQALVPQVRFDHVEGNSPAHLLSCLTGSSLQVLIEGQRLQLGRWQGVFLCEFDGPRQRRLWVQLQGAD